ncbi:MAG: hypothetical protein JWN52_8072 [Actinomycetia bacterium]|nr:hypothetical protein [Actinomycetes bacterium]
MAEGLPGGWTFDDLTGMARHVARSTHWLILDQDEAGDVAAAAMVERLYQDPPPDRTELFRAARRAVGAANDEESSYCGLDRHMARRGRDDTPPRWARYWHGGRALVSPFEERVIEEIAVVQVWRDLSPRHRETLDALVTQGNYEAARTLLGLSAGGWKKRLSAARLQARELWFWPEAPSRHWALDRPGLDPDASSRNRGLRRVARQRQAARSKSALPPQTDTASV